MKAVIVDLKGKYAAALDESGSIIRIRNANYSIGQTIQVQEVNRSRALSLKRLGSVTAAAVLIFAIGTGTAYATPYGTVSLDADSAIEYTINRFDRVLKVKALNEEGEALLNAVDERALRFRPVEQAISATLEKREPASDEAGSIQITAETRSERHTERLREHLMERIPMDASPVGEKPGQNGRPEPAENGFTGGDQPVPKEPHEVPRQEARPGMSEPEDMQDGLSQNTRPPGEEAAVPRTSMQDTDPNGEHGAEALSGLPAMPAGQENSAQPSASRDEGRPENPPATGDEMPDDPQSFDGERPGDRQWNSGEVPAPPQDSFGVSAPGGQLPPP